MDTVHIEMCKDPVGVRVVCTNAEGVRTDITTVPADEWAELRAEAKEHYDLKHSTRVDCTNIITALSIALSDR